MEDSPELVKLLKYLLFGYLVIQIPLSSFALVLAESGDPSAPSDFPPHNNYPPNLISPFSENYKLRTGLNDIDRSSKEVESNNLRLRDNLRGVGGPQFLLNKFGGSLCSIFKTFLDPLENRRRFNRCHVNSQRPRQRPPRGPPPPMQNHPDMSIAMAMAMAQAQQQDHDQRMAMMMQGQGQGGGSQGHGGMMMMMMGDESAYPQQQQARRHQQHDLDDEQINTSGEVDMANVAEEEGHHDGEDGDHQSLDGMGHHGGPGDDLIDETKISQDRTMILVPERSCPQGQRRDARGYCRRLVKIRTNYEYGPPPLRSSGSQQQQNSLVRPIPIRYYYSRIVSIPAFQFFYPNVRV